MYKWIKPGLLIGMLLAGSAWGAENNVGRTATSKEIAAWNIDVRPDFQGLPAGSGSVSRGQQVWDSKCASCHGSFGESNQVFTPIVGGTTAKDIASGRVAALANNREPQRTSLMKLATVSTLWDYINRAMPWNAPKTLTTEEVYAVTAYILNMGEIVPDGFVLSDKNIAEVKLPNRNGMQQNHGMWLNNGKADVNNTACMQNCEVKGSVTSRLPAHAAGSHGDLAQQMRLIGGTRGVALASNKDKKVTEAALPDAAKLLQQHQCISCHASEQKLIGPAWRAIADKYQGQTNSDAKLLQKLKHGGSGVWGEMPMPPQGHVPETQLQSMLRWILNGAK